MSASLELREGWIDAAVATDFPDLALTELTVPVGSGPSRPEVGERLRYLSRRMTGAEAVAFRTRPIPQAYRVLFRHLGLDPDDQRPPGEAVMVERLIKGEYAAENLLDDAITVAVAETGVPVWAVDEAALDGPLGIRPSRPGETMGVGDHVNELPPRRLVVADAVAPVGVLFGLHAPSHRVSAATQASRLFSVRAPGVPAIHVEEALWIAVECLGISPESG